MACIRPVRTHNLIKELSSSVARRGILDFYPVVFRLSRSFLDSFLGFFTPISWLSKFKYIVFKSSRF